MKKPHVIMIAADQLRYDVLGKGYTPNLDELAKESLRYQNAYCTSPLCVPARGSLFTGLCPNSTECLINPWEKEDAHAGYVKEGIDNLYEIMERNEWDCYHSGKQHLFVQGEALENRSDSKTHWLSTEKTYSSYLKEHGKRAPGGPHFRSPVLEIRGRNQTFLTSCSNSRTGCYEEGERFYFDDYFTHMLLEGIQKRDLEKPLFLSAMYLAPHPPFDIPQPWYSKYSIDEIKLPENVGKFYEAQSPLQLYNVTGVLGAHCSLDDWKESWRVYLGLVSFLDHCIGQVINELKNQGIYEESLILFTSDHGEMLGSHGLFQKMCMYQESVKVPLYLKLPNAKTSKDIYEDVSHIDVLPTICQLLDVSALHQMEGTVLPGIQLPEAVITGSNMYPLMSKSRSVFIQYDGNSALSGYQRCIIKNHLKLIVDVFKDEYFLEFYDLEHDIQETENLIFNPQFAPLATPLYEELLNHMVHTKDSFLDLYIERCIKRDLLTYR